MGGFIWLPLVFWSFSNEIREISGGIPSRLRPCESKLYYSALRSTLLTMILRSIFVSFFFYHPLMVHSFSATASKAGSNTTYILVYCSLRFSSDLNSRYFRIKSSCASALVSTKSMWSESDSLKSIWCLSSCDFWAKSSTNVWVLVIKLFTSKSIFWFSDLAA